MSSASEGRRARSRTAEVSTDPKSSAAVKYRERRRGVRVNALIPVTLEWAGGSEDREQTAAQTRVVGPYGCLVVLPQELSIDQRVCLTNRANNRRNIAVVVWKGRKRAEGLEFGLELVDPEMDFWGLEL